MLHFSKKDKAVSAKNWLAILGFINRVDWDVFLYDCNVDDD